MKQLWLTIATFFYTGKIPIAPGTFGSLAAMLIVYFVRPYWSAPIPVQMLIILVVFFVGIPAATAIEKASGKKDPGSCVIDEVAGQMLTLLMAPHSIAVYIAGFFIFRFFDIVKPYPIRELEKIPQGLGIMVDDIGAGLYSLILLQSALYVNATLIKIPL